MIVIYGSYKALSGRKFWFPLHWDVIRERKFFNPKLVELTSTAIENIQNSMKTAKSRQKSYANVRRWPLEFEVVDYGGTYERSHTFCEERKAESSIYKIIWSSRYGGWIC